MSSGRRWAIGCALFVVFAATAMLGLLYVKVRDVPRSWIVSETVDIDAPAERVRERILDLEHWGDWSEWKRDSAGDVTRAFTLQPGHVGSTLRWSQIEPLEIRIGPGAGAPTPSAHKDAGEGTLEVTALGATSIALRTEFRERLAMASAGRRGGAWSVRLDAGDGDFILLTRIELEPRDEFVRLRWSDEVELGDGFVRGMLAAVFARPARGAHQNIVQQSLLELKRVCETKRR